MEVPRRRVYGDPGPRTGVGNGWAILDRHSVIPHPVLSRDFGWSSRPNYDVSTRTLKGKGETTSGEERTETHHTWYGGHTGTHVGEGRQRRVSPDTPGGRDTGLPVPLETNPTIRSMRKSSFGFDTISTRTPISSIPGGTLVKVYRTTRIYLIGKT